MNINLFHPHVLIAFGLHLLGYWVTAFIYFLLDYKTGRYAKIGNNYVETAKKSFINQIFYGSWPFATYMFEWHSTDPYYLYEILLGALGVLIFFEIYFYYLHRLFHVQPFYNLIHAEHHRLHVPFAVAAYDAHPLEILLLFNLPFSLGFVILNALGWKVPMYSMYLIILLASINVVKAHSGYNWKFFKCEFHEIHHRKRNYNYGFSVLLDQLSGTYWNPKIIES